MHYYQFNIADYRKDTTHLTPIEHYIYRTLIDWCYLDELGIPKKTQSVLRRLGLLSENEESLLNVLNDFFFEGENAWFHQRISDEIAKFHEKSCKNAENGKKGGRPKKQQHSKHDNIDEKPKKTQSVFDGKRNESELKPNQEPITNNQEPIKDTISNEIVIGDDSCESPPAQTKKPNLLKATDMVQMLEGLSLSVATDYIQFRKQKKAPLNATAWKAICREVLKTKVSPDEAIAEAMAAGWTGFKAEWFENRRTQSSNTQTKQNVSDLGERNRAIAREAAERYRNQQTRTTGDQA